jgi:predicted RNA-binding Zn-ribbon protein involved in translation (DUF1610 family)
MPINMSCPSCGKTLSAPDSAAGKKARCPSCSQIMIVPAAGTGGEMSSNPPPPPSTLAPRAAQTPGQPSWPSDDDFSAGPAAGSSAGALASASSGASGDAWLDDISPQAHVPQDAGGEARRPCPECGEMISTAAKKCRFCGTIFDYRLRGSIGNRTGGTSHNGMAVTSMVLGIVAFPGLCLIWPGVILAILAIVFGAIALGGMKQTGNNEGKGMAIAGIALGSIPLALGALAFIGFLVLGMAAGHH